MYFSKYFLLIALVFFLGACKQAPFPKKSSVGKADTEKKEALHVLFRSDFLPASVVDTFSRETGIPVAVQVCDSDEEMQQLFTQSPGTYDVIQPDESLAVKWVQQKKLAPLSEKTIPNIKNLDLCFLGRYFDPSNHYTVPYLSGIMGILYNSEQVKGAVQNYDDIFNPKYAGRIIIPNDNWEMVATALAQLNMRFEILESSNIENVQTLLTQWVPLIGKYDPKIPAQTLLRRGDAVAAVVRSGDAAVLVQEDPKFKWVIPPGGGHLFVENLAISAATRHQHEAERFINFLLRPDISAKISRQYPYLNPNRMARDLLSKEDQKCLCLLSQNSLRSNLQLFPSIDSEIFQNLSRFVETLRPN